MKAVRDLFHETPVRDIGPLPAPRLAINATVHHALQMLVRARRGAIVILEGLRPIGIFTERDIVYRLADEMFTTRDNRGHTPLREVMSQPPVTVQRSAMLEEAIEIMVREHYRHLVVVDRHGDLRGLLTTADLVQFLTDQFPDDIVHLPPQLRQQYHRPEGA